MQQHETNLKKDSQIITKYVPVEPNGVVTVVDGLPLQEELAQDSKTLIFMLLKQLKIGMDLSRIVLPTFVLEPRSTLEKLSDFLTHVELLALVPKINDPLLRMRALVKWYLSGFYIKPKGVKKPYNPLLGEIFRCMWDHSMTVSDVKGSVSSTSFKSPSSPSSPVGTPSCSSSSSLKLQSSSSPRSPSQSPTSPSSSSLPSLTSTSTSTSTSSSSKTFLVCEQVSHHPPVAACYASNRKEGFVINGSILFRSKFYGTSVGSILEGSCIVYILPFDEEYELTFPSLYAKGFLFGTLMMELVGTVHVRCRKTGYSAEIEFRQKPVFGGDYNALQGKIFHRNTPNNALYQIQGKWDSRIEIVDTRTHESSIFWQPTVDILRNRIVCQKPARDMMLPNESDRLWEHVSAAILQGDQNRATEEKSLLERRQREDAKARTESGILHEPKLFILQPTQQQSTSSNSPLSSSVNKTLNNSSSSASGSRWVYKYMNRNVWNPLEDLEEYEADNGIIYTRKRNQ